MVIEDCVAYDNLGTGIVVEAKDLAEIRGVAIRRSVAYGNGWDGIKIHSARDGVIEYCTAYRNGGKVDGRIGIWCWNSENIIIQFCEPYENVNPGGPGAYDGGGFDIDWSCVNCVRMGMGNWEGFAKQPDVEIAVLCDVLPAELGSGPKSHRR